MMTMSAMAPELDTLLYLFQNGSKMAGRNIGMVVSSATKLHHIEGAVKSLDVRLTADDIRYLEEPYVPHNLSGVMAVNKPAMSEEPVWVTAAKNR